MRLSYTSLLAALAIAASTGLFLESSITSAPLVDINGAKSRSARLLQDVADNTMVTPVLNLPPTPALELAIALPPVGEVGSTPVLNLPPTPALELAIALPPAEEVGMLIPGPEGELVSASEALFGAVRRGDVDEMGRLFAEGASTDVYSPQGTTPLIEAIELRDVPVINALLTNGVDTNLPRRPDGITPLALALDQGNLALMEVLLNAGADINLKNAFGDTVLLAALKAPMVNYMAVELLLSRKASPLTSAPDFTATDAEGRTAEDIARERVSILESVSFFLCYIKRKPWLM